MAFSLHDAAAPLFANVLTDMRGFLDKAEAWAAENGGEAALIEARLAPDMRPLPAQYQMASDSAKGAVARLAGIEPPAMPDTETSFADLRARVDATLAFIHSVPAADVAAGAGREVVLKFGGGMGYRFAGGAFLTGFAIPNFLFHATTAYAILRAAGVPLGKADFLAHLGPPQAV